MIRDIPLATSGGTDPFTGLPVGGSPITGNGSNGQLLRFHPNYARLMIFITGLSGTSPSITTYIHFEFEDEEEGEE